MRTKIITIAALALLIAPLASGTDVNVFLQQELALQTQGLSTQATDVEVMTARLAPMDDPVIAHGLVLLQTWFDANGSTHQNFRANVTVQVPGKVPGFATIADAMDADVRLRFSHHGNVYAECQLAVEPVVSRSFVYYAVDLKAVDDNVKPLKGVCDVNMLDTGTQVGVPTLAHGVMVNTVVMGKPFHEWEFMVGYCE